MRSIGRHSILVLGVIAAIAGCGNASSTKPQPAATGSELTTCVRGWWEQTHGPCTAACSGEPANPECGFDDCVQFGFSGYLQDGTVYDGLVSTSSRAGTASSIGPVSSRKYSVTDEGIKVEPPGTLVATGCSGDQLKAIYATHERAQPALASTLERALAESSSFRGARLGAR